MKSPLTLLVCLLIGAGAFAQDHPGTGLAYDEIIGIMGNDREPFGDFARGFSLKEITYPTGGKTVFYYYEPAFGIRSVTDENNVSQFFEYDNMGRLKKTNDNDRNPLKTYSYHYKE